MHDAQTFRTVTRSPRHAERTLVIPFTQAGEFAWEPVA